MQAVTGSWLLAVMLSMWCAPHEPPDQKDLQRLEGGLPGGRVHVEVMLPLYAALSGAGQSVLRQQSALESTAASSQHWRPLDMQGMVQLVSEALRSNCRCVCLCCRASLQGALQAVQLDCMLGSDIAQTLDRATIDPLPRVARNALLTRASETHPSAVAECVVDMHLLGSTFHCLFDQVALSSAEYDNHWRHRLPQD